MTAVSGNAPPARASHYAKVPEGVPELVSLWDPPCGTTRSRSPTGCRRPERSSAGCRSGRGASAPPRCAHPGRCIGAAQALSQPRGVTRRRTSLSLFARSKPNVAEFRLRTLARDEHHRPRVRRLGGARVHGRERMRASRHRALSSGPCQAPRCHSSSFPPTIPRARDASGRSSSALSWRLARMERERAGKRTRERPRSAFMPAGAAPAILSPCPTSR
jgi:hypothetical protein